MATETKAKSKSAADHYRAAASRIERAMPNLKAALAELTPDGEELPFAARVAECMNDLENAAKRLNEYAAGAY